jgi:hypothetical protein
VQDGDFLALDIYQDCAESDSTVVFATRKRSAIMSESHPLAIEIARYNEELESLLCDEGKFALVKGKEKIETFDSYDDALKVGYEKYGLDAFLVKKITRFEQVMNFTRVSISPYNPCQA